MFRVFGGALRTCSRYLQSNTVNAVRNGNCLLPVLKQHNRQFSAIINYNSTHHRNSTNSLLSNIKIQQIASKIGARSVTKFSWQSGKRKAVKAVLRRFYRLHWGGWIRTKAGRHKKLWKKSSRRKRRLRQHVFCNATQSTLLDKMVTSFWRRPKYYIDDPYAPYHTREECRFTYKEPKPYFPKEET